jgi:hypothetical protein
MIAVSLVRAVASLRTHSEAAFCYYTFVAAPIFFPLSYKMVTHHYEYVYLILNLNLLKSIGEFAQRFKS